MNVKFTDLMVISLIFLYSKMLMFLLNIENWGLLNSIAIAEASQSDTLNNLEISVIQSIIVLAILKLDEIGQKGE